MTEKPDYILTFDRPKNTEIKKSATTGIYMNDSANTIRRSNAVERFPDVVWAKLRLLD